MSPPDHVLQTNDERIAWVLAHPGMSPWLKEALASARARDPVEILNALEILYLLLRRDCEARMQTMRTPSSSRAACPGSP